MKKELPLPLIIIAIVAVLGAAIGFFVMKSNETSAVTTMDPKAMRDRMMNKQQSGQLPAPAPNAGAGAGPQGSGGAGMQNRMRQQYQSGGYNPPPGPR